MTTEAMMRDLYQWWAAGGSQRWRGVAGKPEYTHHRAFVPAPSAPPAAGAHPHLSLSPTQPQTQTCLIVQD